MKDTGLKRRDSGPANIITVSFGISPTGSYAEQRRCATNQSAAETIDLGYVHTTGQKVLTMGPGTDRRNAVAIDSASTGMALQPHRPVILPLLAETTTSLHGHHRYGR